MTKDLIERLRQLELRITMGANEACGEAATLLEHQTALLVEARDALRTTQRNACDGQCSAYDCDISDDEHLGWCKDARATLKSLEAEGE